MKNKKKTSSSEFFRTELLNFQKILKEKDEKINLLEKALRHSSQSIWDDWMNCKQQAENNCYSLDLFRSDFGSEAFDEDGRFNDEYDFEYSKFRRQANIEALYEEAIENAKRDEEKSKPKSNMIGV